MKIIFTNTILVLLGLQFLGCSIDVKKANAPTDPPKVAKSFFSSSQIVGHFRASAPVMFLWPVDRWDEAAQAFVPLSFSEQAEVRKNIVKASEDKAFYEAEFFATEKQLDEKYLGLQESLKQEYVADRCYALCDPFELSCFPGKPETFFQDAWIDTDDPEELALIEKCIANENERRGLEADQTEEEEVILDPIEAKMIAANESLLATVGNRNFFNDFTTLELVYGPVASCEVVPNDCLDIDPGQTGLVVKVLFTGGGFSNVLNSGQDHQISEVDFDQENGFLTFKVPLIDFADENRVTGELFFDLELNPKGKELIVGGDIRRTLYATGKTRVGRISASGPIMPIEN